MEEWVRWCLESPWSHGDYANTDLLAMFHSRAGFWELLSFSADAPPLDPSFSGLSCSHWAVPMLMHWRSIWYWRSSTSDPGSCRMPRLKARLGRRIGESVKADNFFLNKQTSTDGAPAWLNQLDSMWPSKELLTLAAKRCRGFSLVYWVVK